MRNSGQRLMLSGLAGAVALGVLAGSAVAGAYRHPRDEAGFRTYTRTYVGLDYDSRVPLQGQQDRRWMFAHEEVVLQEADRACRWLGTQPVAPALDLSGRLGFEAVLRRYLATPPGHVSPLSVSSRSTVVAGGWEYLCRGEREAHTAPASDRGD